MAPQLEVQCVRSILGNDSIESLTLEPIGDGLMSDCYRLFLISSGSSPHYDRKSTLIYKTAAEDATSRTCGLNYGLYLQEVRFYRDLASSFPKFVPKCGHASFSAAEGAFDIFMSDAAPAVAGDDIACATFRQAQLAMQAIGQIHGQSLRNTQWPNDIEWLSQPPENLDSNIMHVFLQHFIALYGESMEEQDIQVCKALVENFDTWIGVHVESCIEGLMHGDYRLDNMLFSEEGPAAQPITIVDWQNVKWSRILGDVAYFLGGCLRPEDLEVWLEPLLKCYVDSVDVIGVLDLDRAWKDLKVAAFYGIMINIASATLLKRTERRDRLLPLLTKRHCHFVRRLGALQIFHSRQGSV